MNLARLAAERAEAGRRAAGALPIGLAHGLRVLRPVATGTLLTRDDVEALPESPALALRAEAEALAT